MNRLIIFILSILGFSSCTKDVVEVEQIMYGVEYSKFSITGNVVDEDGNPIEGIEVSPYDEKYPDVLIDNGTLTDKDGKFSAVFYEDIDTYSYAFKDVDGEKNGGEFETKIITVSPKDEDWKEDNERFFYNIEEDIVLELNDKE